MIERRSLCLSVSVAVVGGCAVGPDYQPPDTQAPATWTGMATTGPATQPTAPASQPAGPTTRPADLTDWWKTLNDPLLDSLIDRAVQSNLDLRVAQARIAEARAARNAAAADLWPQLNLGASYAYRGGSLNTGPKTEGGLGPAEQVRNTVVTSTVRSLISGQAANATAGGVTTPRSALGQVVSSAISRRLEGDGVVASRDQNLFQAGFDASWELDIFGGIRRGVEAADADLAAAQASFHDVLVTLLAEVAINYVRLRGYQRELTIALENVQIQQDTLQVTTDKAAGGFQNKLAVAQARAQLATTQAQVPLLSSAIRQTIHQLGVLLGQPPGELLPELEQAGSLPAVPEEVPIGLPSDLLRRRPDIRSAERELAAANARVGQAVADLFPSFSLTGSIGPQSRNTRHLMDWQSFAWSIGPRMSWPVLDGWRIRSNIEIQNARQEQALAYYQQTVLNAFQEVENALVAYIQEQVRCRSLREAVQASQKAVNLSNDLYAAGQTNFLNVLESERALYASQDALVQSETAVITNLIALYKALGGGWKTP